MLLKAGREATPGRPAVAERGVASEVARGSGERLALPRAEAGGSPAGQHVHPLDRPVAIAHIPVADVVLAEPAGATSSKRTSGTGSAGHGYRITEVRVSGARERGSAYRPG